MDFDLLYELYPFLEDRVNKATTEEKYHLYLSGSGSYDLDPYLIDSSDRQERIFSIMDRMLKDYPDKQSEFAKKYEFVIRRKGADFVAVTKSVKPPFLRRKSYRGIL